MALRRVQLWWAMPPATTVAACHGAKHLRRCAGVFSGAAVRGGVATRRAAEMQV
jgi:hypothetical protein